MKTNKNKSPNLCRDILGRLIFTTVIRLLYRDAAPGRPRSISDEKVAMLIRKTLPTKSQDRTHWTFRSLAKETKLSRPTVHRIWQAFGLQPHRQRHFKLSTDHFFVEKARDIVGLYLNPPDKAMVSCVDEKSQVFPPGGREIP